MNGSLGRTLCGVATATLLLIAQARAVDRLLPLDVVFREPTTYSYRLNPDNSLLVGYLNLANGKQLVLLDAAGSEPRLLLNFGELAGVELRDYGWIDNDTLYVQFANRRDPNRLAFIDIAAGDGEGDTTIRMVYDSGLILDAAADRDDTLFFAREIDADDGKYRLYTITVDQLVSGDFRSATQFRTPLDGAVYYRRDAVGGGLLAATADDGRVSHWYLPAGEDRWVRFFEHGVRDFQFIPLAFVAPGRVAVLSNQSTNLVSLMVFDVESQAVGEVLYQHARYDLTNAEISPQTGEPRSVSYTDHGIAVTEYLVDSDSRLLDLLARTFPGKQTRIVSGREGSARKVVWVSASDDPGSFYLFDVETRHAELLTARYEGIDAYALSRSAVFTIASDDGHEIEAIVARPAASNGVLLVNPHGGPVGVRDTASYDPETQFFTNRGYTVLKVNFRGSWGFGKEFLETGRGQFGQRIEDDIGRAVDELMAREKFDNVCSIGASYGGYSAVMLAIRQPQRYRCVVASFGIYDLPYLFNTSNFTQLDRNRRAIEYVVGEYGERLTRLSPLYLADSLQAPVLLIAGEEDDVADYEHSNRMKYRLQQLGKPVEYFFYRGVGHGHRNWNGDRHEFALADDFMRRTLGLPLPDAINAGEVLGDGYYRIASYYEASAYPEHDNALTLDYLHKAADLEHPQALLWLASLHEDGRGVQADFAAAMSHYRRAAELGGAAANYRLGEIYRDGERHEITDADPAARSFGFFARAHELDHELARFELALALCSGYGVQRDVHECLSLLSLQERNVARRARARRNAVLAELMWDEGLPATVRQAVVDSVREETHSRYSKLGIVGLRSGVVEGNRQYRDRPVPMTIGSRFGVSFRVNRWRSDGDAEDGYAVAYRWIGPRDMRDGSGYHEQSIRLLSAGGENSFTYKLEYEWELVPGEWRLQIATLGGERVVDEVFQVRTP